jgi:hypothetical protein
MPSVIGEYCVFPCKSSMYDDDNDNDDNNYDDGDDC